MSKLKPVEEPAEPINVREFGYLRVGNCSELIKLNWRKMKREKSDEQRRGKLFTVATVEKLIQVSVRVRVRVN